MSVPSVVPPTMPSPGSSFILGCIFNPDSHSNSHIFNKIVSLYSPEAFNNFLHQHNILHLYPSLVCNLLSLLVQCPYCPALLLFQTILLAPLLWMMFLITLQKMSKMVTCQVPSLVPRLNPHFVVPFIPLLFLYLYSLRLQVHQTRSTYAKTFPRAQRPPLLSTHIFSSLFFPPALTLPLVWPI